jgi:hypothetical protein
MIMKTDTNGNVTLTYDGSTTLRYDDSVTKATIGTVWDSVATTSSVKSAIEEITKKPEVRVDQRSALNIG